MPTAAPKRRLYCSQFKRRQTPLRGQVNRGTQVLNLPRTASRQGEAQSERARTAICQSQVLAPLVDSGRVMPCNHRSADLGCDARRSCGRSRFDHREFGNPFTCRRSRVSEEVLHGRTWGRRGKWGNCASDKRQIEVTLRHGCGVPAFRAPRFRPSWRSRKMIAMPATTIRAAPISIVGVGTSAKTK